MQNKSVLTALLLMLFKIVGAQVNVGFTINNATQCLNNNLFIFTNTTTPLSGTTFYWTFDDGTTSTQANPTKTYTQARTFNVTLIATRSGINYYSSKQISVEPIPQVSFNVIKGTLSGASFTFISTSTIASGSMNYYWTFGDGTSSTLINPTKSYTQTGVNQVKLRVTGNTGCGDSSIKTVYPILCTIGNWIGVENSKWNNVNNWCISTLPTSTDTIRVLKGCVNMPKIDSGIITIPSLQIDSSSILYVKNNATLQVNGNIISNGYLIADSGTVIMNAPQQQSIQSLYNYTIKNLTLKNNGKTTLTGMGICNITGVLQFATGTNYDTLFTNGNLTLASTINGTATVADITNGNQSWGNAIIGEVSVQRYLQNKRSWRLLTAPLTTYNTSKNGSIYSNRQNGGVNIAGFGTNITAPGGLNGYDVAINQNYSLRTYNSILKKWDNPPATNTNNSLFSNATSAANKAYFLFARGDRSITSTSNLYTQTATTLTAKGNLQQGTQTFNIDTLPANAYYLIGNPYPAPIDFSKVVAQSTNILSKFYIWSSNLASVAAYITCVWNGTTYVQSPQTLSTQPNIIQSGEAFFVHIAKTGNAKVIFTEQCKATSANTTVLGAANNQVDMIAVNLYKKDAANTILVDGIVKMYSNNFDDSIAGEDAAKFSNIDENLAIASNGKLLAIEGKNYFANADTIQLNTTNLKQNQYQLQINPTSFYSNVGSFYIKDNYTNTQTNLSSSSINNYDFEVNANAASFAKNRFSIVIVISSTLSSQSIDLKVTQNQDKTGLQWTTTNINNIKFFEVEQRNNQEQFKTITTVATTNQTTNEHYNIIQSNSTQFYRIKAVLQNDKILYSNTVNILAKNSTNTLSILPNIVTNNSINLNFNSITQKKLQLNIINNNGNIVFSKEINPVKGNNNTTTAINNNLQSGIYWVTLHNDEMIFENQKITIIK